MFVIDETVRKVKEAAQSGAAGSMNLKDRSLD
jgi:hypothetical protein